MPPMNLEPADLLEMPDFPPGEVWLAGAGPGDPRLLTLLALHAIKRADDIVHDALVDKRVLQLARPGAQMHFAGKRGGRPSPRQHDINETVIALAHAGKRVLRLKGGDPFVFGRGMEEAMALCRAGIRFRIIPGITAGLGGAMLAGVPSTTRDTNYAVILASGHRAPGASEAQDWAALARTGQPIVLYMAMANLAEITGALMRGGLAGDTPVAVIASATASSQQVVDTTLRHVVAEANVREMGAPAIVVVGATAGLRQQLLDGMVPWT